MLCEPQSATLTRIITRYVKKVMNGTIQSEL